MSTASFGMIGLGYWGQNILRNMAELNILHTACDTSVQILEERQKKFPGIRFTSDFNALLLNPEIKGMMIATPAVTHYELAKATLMADKDVFVEKPLALTIQQGQELVDLARERKRILMVGHILQYHPAILKLKDMIKQGEIGKLQYVYSNRLNIGKLRVEENIIWSFAPHDISVILMLVGEEPVKVSGFGGSYLNDDVFDVTLTHLEFRNKVKAHVFVSWLHPFKEQKLVVVGSQAMVVFDDVSKEKLFFYPHSIKWENGKIPVAQKADFQCVPFEFKEPLKEELSHFVECVAQRKKPRTDGEEGLRVLSVLEQIENSIRG
ncbi:MAG: Gfo/Idh/MocA family oxidoreductase [Candidatus Omnitrophica bacterium]|nr:Gfo/Idh/MocA family oxidoreductase [Candidatus Omnitrophota bacterium]